VAKRYVVRSRRWSGLPWIWNFPRISISTDFPWISMDIHVSISTDAYRAYMYPHNFRKIHQCKSVHSHSRNKTWHKHFSFEIVQKLNKSENIGYLHWDQISVKYFSTVMKIYIILSLLLWSTVMSICTICRFLVVSLCVTIRRRGRRWYR